MEHVGKKVFSLELFLNFSSTIKNNRHPCIYKHIMPVVEDKKNLQNTLMTFVT
jgi:hypothetical protein